VGDAQEAARRRGRETNEIRREDGFDQPVPLVLGRDEPPQREHERPGGRLLRERDPALGCGPRHARVVERPQQPADVRALPADHDRELSPRDTVVDVEAPELPCHGRVLLRGVCRGPRIDAHRLRGAMGRGQFHVRRSGEHLREPEGRDGGRPLEGEDVRLRVRGDDEVARSERLHERLLREGGVVVVVDEQMVEERLGRGGRRFRSADQRREVDDAIGIQHVEVGPGEPREFEPTAEIARRGFRLDLLGCDPGLLGPEQELPDLVREPPQGEQVAVCRPLGGILTLEQVLDERELIGSGQHLGRLRVAEGGEALPKDQVTEAVEGQYVEAGQRRRQSRDEGVARGLARAARSHDQRDALGIRAALHESREPFAEHRGFAGSGGAGDEERTRRVREDGVLCSIGRRGGVHEADATASRRHHRDRGVAVPAPHPRAWSPRRSGAGTTGPPRSS
jgi:hypothetical protein